MVELHWTQCCPFALGVPLGVVALLVWRFRRSGRL